MEMQATAPEAADSVQKQPSDPSISPFATVENPFVVPPMINLDTVKLDQQQMPRPSVPQQTENQISMPSLDDVGLVPD